MPNVGAAEIVIVLVYVLVVAAVIALPFWILREMRRRGDQLDRIERRLDDLDGRRGPDPR
jgi:branched-subunit amino acid transport protein AzlD